MNNRCSFLAPNALRFSALRRPLIFFPCAEGRSDLVTINESFSWLGLKAIAFSDDCTLYQIVDDTKITFYIGSVTSLSFSISQRFRPISIFLILSLSYYLSLLVNHVYAIGILMQI